METLDKKQGGDDQHDDDHGHLVDVTVDGVKKSVRKGKYIVSEFKAVVGVAPELELDQVIGGEFKPLPNDSEIKIKGGEQFVSHSGGGGSSA